MSVHLTLDENLEKEKEIDGFIKTLNSDHDAFLARNDAIGENDSMNELTHDYNYYLERSKYILEGLRLDKYDTNNLSEAIEHVIQNDYLINNTYAILFRKIIEDSINMKMKIDELEKHVKSLTKKGGSRKLYKNIKTIKNKTSK